MAGKINFKKVNLYNNPYYKAPKENDYYKIENVVSRVESGVVGSLYINDDMNKSIFKPGDIVHFTKFSKLLAGDFILYKEENKYFIRRIIKFKNDDIYVAGDKEKSYHKITKNLIIGKAIARERKLKSISLNDHSKFILYRFKKVKLAYFRLKNRIIEYQQELLDESIELAKKNTTIVNETKRVDVDYTKSIDIDLSGFIDPNVYIDEFLNETI